MESDKKVIVQSNWKMHKTHVEGIDWIESLIEMEPEISPEIELIPCVPLTLLPAIAQAAQSSSQIFIGAQNVYWETWGAYTGEISAPMIADAGASYCVVGHSERRKYFGETDETVNKKIKAVIESGLKPIFCIGETLGEREQDITEDVIARQVDAIIKAEGVASLANAVLAYEPVWAIGTGKTATPEMAQETHAAIRKLIADQNADVAAKVRIQYGGSMNAGNAADLLAMEDIDGGLIGGASLKAADFLAICQAAG